MKIATDLMVKFLIIKNNCIFKKNYLTRWHSVGTRSRLTTTKGPHLMNSYKIVFTEGAKIVRVMTGFYSVADARAAIRDLDLIIPFSWEYEIREALA